MFLFIIESRFSQELEHADHAVERCSDLVTHMSKEFTLGMTRFEGDIDLPLHLL